MCNECGQAFINLPDLQLHLKRKTAWSDMSLVGCRISCLVDSKEWHEGFVRSLSRQGKHCVEFHMGREKRWLNMKRIAFYIAQRPQAGTVFVHGNGSKKGAYGSTTTDGQVSTGGTVSAESSTNDEYKDDMEAGEEDEYSNLAPIEDMEQWVYVEDISLDYAFAQSVLFKVAGGSIQETGHKTKGHICVTESDKVNSKNPDARGSLLYGELLPRGANKAFGQSHLQCADPCTKVLFDLGMGTGKIAIQAFLQYRNLEYVYGIELSEGRFRVAEEYVVRMVQLLGVELYSIERHPSGRRITVNEVTVREGRGRKLVFECGDMFTVQNIAEADVVMMETDIPLNLHSKLCCMLNDMKPGSRTLSYLDLRKIWPYDPFTFRQISSNRHLSDRFPTSWSVQRGHHFFLWQKTISAQLVPSNLGLHPDGFHNSGFETSPGRSFYFSSSRVSSSASYGNWSSDSSRDMHPFSGNGHGANGLYNGGANGQDSAPVPRCSPLRLYHSIASLLGFRKRGKRGKKIGANPDLGISGPDQPIDKICPMEITTGSGARSGSGRARRRMKGSDDNDDDDDEEEHESESDEESYDSSQSGPGNGQPVQLRGLGGGELDPVPSSAIERERV